LSPASTKLWIAQRFVLNERGHYEVAGDCGAERIMVEIEPSVVADQANPEKSLAMLRGKIQAAAREKWDAGEAHPVFFAHSGQKKHLAIALTAGDL
jgi:hypothetical protein